MEDDNRLFYRYEGQILDPRTKIALLISISFFQMRQVGSGAMLYYRPLLAFIPYYLLYRSGKKKTAVLLFFLYLLGMCLKSAVSPQFGQCINFLFFLTADTMSTSIPCMLVFWYTVTSTTVSEFAEAMQRLHIPDWIIAPLSVVFRLLPSVFEEIQAIREAMRMRGLRIIGTKPSALFEYFFMPMAACTLKIGSELTMSALTRGYGSRARTSVCRIGFKQADYAVLLICLIGAVISIGLLTGNGV